MNTAELLTQRLELIYRWYEGMVNPDTGMFEYLYLPQADDFVRERSPFATSPQYGMWKCSAVC